MRVYEFSKEFDIANKDLLKILMDNGFNVANHMSTLSGEALTFLHDYFNKRQEKSVTKQDTSQATLAGEGTQGAEINKKQSEKVMREPERVPEIIKEKPKQPTLKPFIKPVQAEVPEFDVEIGVKLVPMTVGDFATRAQKPVSEVILALLKQGTIATKNQVISEDIVEKLAKLYNVPIIHPEIPVEEKLENIAIELKEERMPVVVVIGHVDHGKTTLLDFIRNTRVAEREKGGITQHLGAYQVLTKHGGLVFLDTPGHEAFSMMRARGVKVADVAILVVAADDSVMPQTVEAIKQAQALNVPIVVAINKIDKVSPVQVEKVKQDLAQYGLMPEAWGGQTIMIPISAKLGTGVDELLEMLTLQTQILELQTDSSIPGRGYVLESKIEKGLGPVATIICQYGTLSVGDHFRAGVVYGKVNALLDATGKRVKSVGPSTPILVAGFPTLPQAGDSFVVIAAEEAKKARRSQRESTSPTHQARVMAGEGEQILKFVLKADNVSSAQALNVGIAKITKALPAEQKIVVVQSGVGDISESDVMLARDTGAVIYGFSVKAELKAASLAIREKVTIKLFDIIYKLFEDMERFAEESKIVRMVKQRIGTAEVLKVFKIKGVGVIAGARVKSGRFVREGMIEVYRGKDKIGGGPIRSLQREKQAVKEVAAGFECAFLIQGFTDWQPGDIAECFIDVPEE